MYKVITIEREYGSGAGEIAGELARKLGWKLWDHELTEEIAKLAHVDPSVVERCDEHVDSTFHRLAKVFWRGSYQRSMPLEGLGAFDADAMVAMMRQVIESAANSGNCVIVGRGAPYFLRECPDAFQVFCYAPYAEKFRRLQKQGMNKNEAEELLGSVDHDRVAFVKHYFDADWPTPALYHVMVNTAMGNANVISVVLDTMRLLEAKPRS